ncbi:unnamed protein product [Euphydryas editha]|uniref:Peptidase S1 domain-containing protein n=1 Tax=Euphydryas editha TaxID=104508 RepID=A0AAU9TJF7_EUPED|nr:unnamed protein product [Euphydryas editha]
MTTPLSSGIRVEDILNVDVSKLCKLNELYSKIKSNLGESNSGERSISENTVPYIYGGRPAIYGEFPHMGALGWRSATKRNKWVYKCGATLISKKFMLTAAHCSYAPLYHGVANTKPEIVQLGDKFIKHEDTIDDNDGPKYISIEKIIKHDDYNSPERYYDIAIVELAEAVNFGPLIRPACLWNNPETSSLDKVSITGWGATHAGSNIGAEELQVAEIDIIEDEICNKLLEERHSRLWSGLSDHQLCAGVLEGGIDSCDGDSGGPLQVEINLKLRESIKKWPMYYEVAVTAFSFKCGRPNTPSIYTKTASFIDWIEDQVWL